MENSLGPPLASAIVKPAAYMNPVSRAILLANTCKQRLLHRADRGLSIAPQVTPSLRLRGETFLPMPIRSVREAFSAIRCTIAPAALLLTPLAVPSTHANEVAIGVAPSQSRGLSPASR